MHNIPHIIAHLVYVTISIYHLFTIFYIQVPVLLRQFIIVVLGKLVYFLPSGRFRHVLADVALTETSAITAAALAEPVERGVLSLGSAVN